MNTQLRTILFGVIIYSLAISSGVMADELPAINKMPQHMQHMAKDSRVSLNLPAPMKVHQLSNMRSHLAAVQSIIGLIAKKDFTTAAKIAHEQLGLTPQMEKMCRQFSNNQFTTLGLGFHKSADQLADTLKTKNVEASLEALNTTMSYCVQCHATFRQ